MPYEIADYHKYLTLWHYSYDALILSCNKDVWDSFSIQEQNLLKVCAQKAMEHQKELARSGLEEALKIFRNSPAKAREYLTEVTKSRMERIVIMYRELRNLLITKY